MTGESGTAKELWTDALYKLSRRRERLFVAINYAAIPRDPLESKAFGHAKGSFAGATADRAGAALQTSGGSSAGQPFDPLSSNPSLKPARRDLQPAKRDAPAGRAGFAIRDAHAWRQFHNSLNSHGFF